MKMIDKFMELIHDVDQAKGHLSISKVWKVRHRKHEILKEIRDNKSFSISDLLNYTWIIQYGMNKWGKGIILQNDVDVINNSRCCRISYNGPLIKFDLICSEENNIRINWLISTNAGYERIEVENITPILYDQCSTHYIINPIFDILKVIFTYSISNTIDLIIKEGMK